MSAIFADLPTDQADPLQRIRKVNNSVALPKGMHDALPAGPPARRGGDQWSS